MTRFSTKWLKYATVVSAVALMAAMGIVYTEKTFPVFLIVWLIAIPIAAVGYLIYGLREYIKERKNAIVISVKHNDITIRYAELIRKEEEIRRAKEALYKELTKKGS